MVKIHHHDVLPKQQMFYLHNKKYLFKYQAYLSYLENGNTSKTNFSNFIPLTSVGLLTRLPFLPIDGIFFFAI